MRALVVYCIRAAAASPKPCATWCSTGLAAAGAEVRLRDLYAEGFDPVLSGPEHAGYEDAASNRIPVARHVEDLQWCDMLIFVYPTWWYGLPAMIKGWPRPGAAAGRGLPDARWADQGYSARG